MTSRISLALCLFFFNSCYKENMSDIIIIAPIFTMNENQLWAEAVAIKNNSIIYVGNKKNVFAYKDNDTHVIENPNGLVLPGFIDNHVHLIESGIEFSGCQLAGLKNEKEIIQEINIYVNKYPNKEWIRGSGFDLTIFKNGNPKKELLDKIIGNRPAYFLSSDAHTAWVNSKALELAGITKYTKDPLNGTIERDPKTKEPSGALREEAKKLVSKILPLYSKEELDIALYKASKEANKFGITTIFDAGSESIRTNESSYGPIDAYRNATKHNDITLRVESSFVVYPDTWKQDIEKLKTNRFENNFGALNTIKIYADGVIEGGTASLFEPYKGTKNHGILNWNIDSLKQVIEIFEKEGANIHVHAIGDRAISDVLDAFEYSQNKNKSYHRRHVISHAQLVHPKDIARFKKLGIVASFQALWAYPDNYIKELTLPVLDSVRASWMYPLGSISSNGGVIVGGSDWSVTSLDPLKAIEVAVTRKEPGRKNGEALNPHESVSLPTILKAYTIDAAYALFKDDIIGSIKVGKMADIVLLNENIFNSPNHEIHKAVVDVTIFDGKIVYTR